MDARRTPLFAQRALLLAILAALPHLCAWAGESPARDNAAAEAAYGIATGQPIAEGFLFIDARFIHGPYVVARRGLSIFINDRFIEMAIGMGKNHQTELDPGDPPTGSSPFDEHPAAEPRAAYWMQKWVYLSSHNDPAAAREKMLEVYRKAGFAKSIEPDADFAPTGYKVTLTNGATEVITLDETWKTEVMPPEFRLKTATAAKERYESSLKGGAIVGYLSQGGYWQVGSAMAAPFLSILLAHAPDPARVGVLTGTAPAPPVHTDDAGRKPPGAATVATPDPSAVAPPPPRESAARTAATSRPWLPLAILGAAVLAVVAFLRLRKGR